MEFQNIKRSNILLVGCGGVGTELIKILITLPFGFLTMVDHDKIELSNLNRQFYFSKNDIGSFKSETIAQKITKIRPKLKIFHFCKRIEDPYFDSNFFSKFSLILSAVDVNATRRFLSKISIKFNIPMIGCGVEGFYGHIRPILPFKTECYFCSNEAEENNKNENSNLALCSIRGIPENNAHCIFWAQQFLEKLTNEKETSTIEAFQIYKKVFYTDIIENFKDHPDLIEKTREVMENIDLKSDFTVENANIYKVWHLNDHIIGFLKILNIFLQNKFDIIRNTNNNMELMLLCDAANIRSYIFQPLSKKLFPFSFADMMGVINRIIPALASANSITAGLMISKMIKQFNYEQNMNIVWFNNKENYRIRSYEMKGKNRNCVVCGDNITFLEVVCNFQKNNFKEIIDYFHEELSIKIQKIFFLNNTIYDKMDEGNKKFFETFLMNQISHLAQDLKELQVELLTEKNEFKIYLDIYSTITNENETKLKLDRKNISKLMKMAEEFRNKKFSEMNLKRSILFKN